MVKWGLVMSELIEDIKSAFPGVVMAAIIAGPIGFAVGVAMYVAANQCQ